jgi:drug/metabolite transporter (DMT)-like permease
MTRGLSNRPLAGMLLVLAATLSFASMDTLIRGTGVVVPVLLLLWARYAFQAVSMALWLARDRTRRFRPAHPRFQAGRGALLLTTSLASFFGLQYMPVPEFSAISLLTPVFVTLLASWLLREQVSWPRGLLVAASFAGALVVVRPGSGLFGWAALLPLACAVAYAFFQVLSRHYAALDDPLVTHFWTGFTGTVLVTPVVLLGVPDLAARVASLSAAQAGLMLAIGALGTFGHLLLVVGFRFAPASRLAPYHYSQLLWAIALSWFAFGHWPDPAALVGMAVIGACGAVAGWLAWRSAASAAARAT